MKAKSASHATITVGMRGELPDTTAVFNDADALLAWRNDGGRGRQAPGVEPRTALRCIAMPGTAVEVVSLMQVAGELALDVRVLGGPSAHWCDS